MSGDIERRASPAKPSSTIIVMREGRSQPELLLVERRAGDAFGECFAFPGGVLDDDEEKSFPYCVGVTPADANATLGLAEGGLAYYTAGIRELFEETGLLLARSGDGNWACVDSERQELRTLVDKGQLPWSAFLAQQDLRVACDALHYFAHWETPFSLPRRWTTRFFVAALPPAQTACHDGIETTDSRWVTAAEALRQRDSGLIDMPYPTIKTLERLRTMDSPEGILDWTSAQRAAGIEMNRPDFARKPRE